MSVEQTATIDAIGIDRTSGKVHLTIADHLPWDSEHLHRLQAKINSYLAFLESGEVYSAYPNARGREFVIDIVALHRPNDAALDFLARAKSAIETAGFGFGMQPSDHGYVGESA